MLKSVVVGTAAAVLVCAAPALAEEHNGASAPFGNGTVQSYTVLTADGAPAEIGVVFTPGAFEGLPAEPNRTSRCFDANGNGSMDHHECIGDVEVDLPFASLPGGRTDVPFTFAMVNWESQGHPPQAWSVPHFDVHFYAVPLAEVAAIRTGTCDALIDCADRERAMKPVPAKYLAPGFADVGATVARMGNHLVDTKSPELATPGTPFTHTWIYGVYDGRITFGEVMAPRDFLMKTADLCTDIRQPQAWRAAGWYPTRYCFRRDAADGSLRIYLSDFVMRQAG